jgi:peroxiredoxin
MQQIVDLENDPAFQALGVQLVSIAFDTPEEQAAGRQEFGIQSTPLLTDVDRSVSAAYDVLQWAVRTGEPGHTFILVNAAGQIAWVRDYGAPENGGVMYVPVEDLVTQIRDNLPAS